MGERQRGSAWPAVIRRARGQSNVIAVSQAVECGVSRSAFEDRTAHEAWPRPFPGIRILPGAEATGETLARAGVLAVGPEAVLTGLSALALHGVRDHWPAVVHVVIPASQRRVAPQGVRIRRTRTLLSDDHRRDRGIHVASVPRAFLDAAAVTGRETLRGLLIDGRQRRKLAVADVVDRVLRHSKAHGRRRLLQACRDVDASGADSVLTEHVESWLRSEGIRLDLVPRTVVTPARVLHPDLTVAGRRIAIEVDGFGSHASRRSLDLDQRKHNAYLLAGWVVLRVSWDRFTRDRAGFLAELRAAIEGSGDPRTS